MIYLLNNMYNLIFGGVQITDFLVGRIQLIPPRIRSPGWTLALQSRKESRDLGARRCVAESPASSCPTGSRPPPAPPARGSTPGNLHKVQSQMTDVPDNL